jgi:hypothetical protein
MKDFGVVYVDQNIKDVDIRKCIKHIMDSNGYNTKACDICSVIPTFSLEQVDVKFKFVHYSVPSMATEPFFKITFREA